MMTMYECSAPALALTGFCAIISMIFNTGCVIGSFTFHTDRKYKILSILSLVASLLVLQMIGDLSIIYYLGIGQADYIEFTGRLPVWVILTALIILLCNGIFLFDKINRMRQYGITVNGIKETIDNLPDGICFYDKNGTTILTNQKMNILSSILTGHEVMNGFHFTDALFQGKFSGGKIIRRSPALYIELDDHTVWNFKLKEHITDNDILYELTGFNVTDQTELYRKIQDKNRIMEDINVRLKKYNLEMKLIVAEKETLESKIRIHDSLGRILLATRTYLQSPEKTISRKELMDMWNLTTAILKNEAEDKKKQDLIKLLEEAAESLGVKIIIKGQIPEETQAGSIFIKTMHECLTNTVRHGRGTELYCNFSADENQYTGEFCNNGIQPEEVKEGNGLGNLRKVVERAGGTMEIQTGSRYVLKVTLMKGKGK